MSEDEKPEGQASGGESGSEQPETPAPEPVPEKPTVVDVHLREGDSESEK